ncbi:hypothetical protein BC936DRAFT_143293 [Jimgerdemannia flammicorona]|uniref:Uncharacterized protein n=1 Tax=Jimgerdemannia flammicorona TaxID=994334 RepID=A0A433DE52_9FUNG|nr:hypothetical protein BC936DRAFT_143293 [Jimgerdemannia flammicorona]
MPTILNFDPDHEPAPYSNLLVGNLDLDFGEPNLQKLVNETKSPWPLSNVLDEPRGKSPEARLVPCAQEEEQRHQVGVIELTEKK